MLLFLLTTDGVGLSRMLLELNFPRWVSLQMRISQCGYLVRSLIGWVSLVELFASVPCSPRINKSSAYHFGPVCVRILLAQNCVMAEAQVPVQAAVPATKAPVQPPAAAANVDNPQQNPAPLQPPFKRLKFSYTVPAWESSGSFSPPSGKRDSILWVRHDGKPLQPGIQSPQLCNFLLASDWVESMFCGDVSADVSMLAFRILLDLYT